MAEEKQDATAKLIARMDGVADALLALIGKEETSDAQKGRLFTTVQSWMKLRQTLAPKDEGDKLKDMSNAIKSSSSRGKRDTGRAAPSRTTEDGRAIAAIIKRLPKPGNARAADGDSKGAERESLGGAGAGGVVPLNGSGDVVGNVDGARNLN